jgi:hypothetical protein
MSYTLLSPQPAQRDSSLADDEIGPGLYPDEAAVELDDGSLVAVSAVAKWQENGAGVILTGCARHIDADGTTHLCPYGAHVETSFSHTAGAGQVAQVGVDAIAKEMMLAMLGEPLTGLVQWSPELLTNVSIRAAIAAVASTGPTAINPASLLG